MPRVSVIIPVYGVEKYIERCADSLFNQSLDGIEFIFIDDCTPDRSIELLEARVEHYHLRILEKNWTVRIERMPANCGIAVVRWHGIQLATGDFIIQCDSDDWVDHDIYKKLYERALKDNSDVVICDYYKADSKRLSRVNGCYKTDRNSLIYDILSEKASWSVCNKLIKTNLYRDHEIMPPKNNMGEDMVLTLQILFLSQTISYIHEALYYYYNNPRSITNVVDADSVFSHYTQLLGNTKLLFSLWDEHNVKQSAKCIEKLKFNVKKALWILVSDSGYRAIWKSTYPEINSRILINPLITVKDKIKYILTLLHIFPQLFYGKRN